MAGRASFRATKPGIDLVDERRIKRGWSRKSLAFAQVAGVGVATLGRFWPRKDRLDKASIMGIFKAVGLDNWEDYVESEEPSEPLRTSRTPDHTPEQIQDGLPECPVFYGRSKDLTLLSNWVLKDGYRVLAILGIGGLGKTAFAIKLIELLLPQFEGVIWRSMHHSLLT